MSEHEMSDAQFGKIFGAMIASMVTLTVVLIILAFIVTQNVNARMAAQKEADRTMEINTRIAPVGSMNVGAAEQTAAAQPEAAGAAPTEALSGEAVYTANCAACHAAGVAGAPKLGDAATWSQRLAQGDDILYEHAIKGYQGSAGYMPAKGGNANLSDDEVKAAVDHMVANSK